MSALLTHETRGDVPPYPDTKVTLAFGDDVFPVLVARLASHVPEVLISALTAGNRLLPTPLNAVKAVAAGAIPEYVRLCKHADVAIRRRAVEALQIAMKCPQAKEAFVAGGHLDPFRAVLHDADADAQLLALSALDILGAVLPYPDALLRSGYIRVLVDLARTTENMDVKAASLHTLLRCINAGSPGQHEAVVVCGAIPVLISMLVPASSGRVREEAAHALGLLAFLPEARRIAVTAGAVPAICAIMGDRSAGVRAEAAGVAMALTVDNDAKSAFVRDGLKPLVALLADANLVVRLNSLRAVGAIAANPDGRSLLRGYGAVEEARKLVGSAHKLEAEVAANTVAVLEWTA